MAVWWSERLPVGKRRGDEWHMWRSTCIYSDHTDMQPITQDSGDGHRPLTPPGSDHPPAFLSVSPSHTYTELKVPKALSDPLLLSVRSKLAGG
ncbi:hypothetical protein PFLUV_G00255510 [Perca fluviatilis]|uniref:Uncharacterized protein n=1 Tax=Perca fluviatilis TaxID=8168 RepID=A0A6A5EAE6_PERFL|nr:hypothetical protein PFLUV_G00255510 [Perca fluviatilis]